MGWVLIGWVEPKVNGLDLGSGLGLIGWLLSMRLSLI